jgi:hypothetical protein
MIRTPCLDLDGARRRGTLLFFTGTPARERRFRDAQFQEEISFERIDDSGRENIGIHRVVLSCNGFFF